MVGGGGGRGYREVEGYSISRERDGWGGYRDVEGYSISRERDGWGGYRDVEGEPGEGWMVGGGVQGC